MKMKRTMQALLFLVAMTASSAVAAQVELRCITLAAARDMVKIAADQHRMAVLEWTGGSAIRFLRLVGIKHTPVIDVVFFYQAPEGNSFYGIGSTALNEACRSDVFALTPSQTEAVLAKFYGQ